jgi:Phage protein Gp138 N-terminal domain
MANPQIQQNQIPNEPQLKDLLDLLKKDILLSLNSHHIGTVQSFDPDDQTIEATINYKKTFYELDSATGLYNPVLLDYPLLLDCPAIVLGGGSAALTFPIQQGDECLVLFNDRDLDNWFAGASNGAVASPRLHSFSDGIVLVGLRSLANAIENYDESRAALRNNQAAVGVRGDNNKVLITNTYPSNSTTLNSLIQQLITAIKGITVNVAGVQTGGSTIVSGTPINSSTFTTIATNLGNLLE